MASTTRVHMNDVVSGATGSSLMIFPVLEMNPSDSIAHTVPSTFSPVPKSPLTESPIDKMIEWRGSDGEGSEFDTDFEILDLSDADSIASGSMGYLDDLTEFEEETARNTTQSSGNNTETVAEGRRVEAVVSLGPGQIYTDGTPFQNLGQSPNHNDPLPNADKNEAPHGSAMITLKDGGIATENAEGYIADEELETESVRAESQMSTQMEDWEANCSAESSAPDDDTVNEQLQLLDEIMVQEQQRTVPMTLEQSIMEWKDGVREIQTAYPSPTRQVSKFQSHERGEQSASAESCTTILHPQALDVAISEVLTPAVPVLFTSHNGTLTQRHNESEEELREMIKTLAKKIEHLESYLTSTKTARQLSQDRPSPSRDRVTSLPSLSPERKVTIRRGMIDIGARRNLPTETIASDRTRPLPHTATWPSQATITLNQPPLSPARITLRTLVSSDASALSTPPQGTSYPLASDTRSINIPPTSARDPNNFYCPYGCPTCTDQTREQLNISRPTDEVSRRRCDRGGETSYTTKTAQVTIGAGTSLHISMAYR